MKTVLKKNIYKLIGFTLFMAYVGLMGQIIPMGAFVPSGGSPSVGSQYAVDLADGSGAWLNSGCNVVPNSTGVNCPAVTYNSTRIITSGGKSCPLFPDNWWGNVDASSYPLDQNSSLYTGYFASTTLPITGASWAGGTATVTVGSTSGLTSGSGYRIYRNVTSTCMSGYECGYNSFVTSLGSGTQDFYTITVTSGTQFTYSLASNPGSFVSGGYVLLTPTRFHQDPAMSLNIANNSTATLTPSNSTWQVGASQSDAGPYPWTSSFYMEGYRYTVASGYIPALVTWNNPGGDNHVLSINMDTCTLYETYGLNTQSPPWEISNGAIWSLYSNDLRTAHKTLFGDGGTGGITSADVGGLPIWPLVLQYGEVFGSSPITHAVRITLPNGSGFYNGFRWPGTHAGSGGGVTDQLGSRWLLPSTFDTTTCHFGDCAGLAWPGYMQRVLVALQHYGAIFADGGTPITITTDANPSWGAVDDATSATYTFEGWLHGIQWTDGNIVDPTQHVVNTLSGASK